MQKERRKNGEGCRLTRKVANFMLAGEIAREMCTITSEIRTLYEDNWKDVL